MPLSFIPALLFFCSALLSASDAVTFLVKTEEELYETVTILESGQNIFIDMDSVQLHKRLNITASRVKIMGRSDGTTLHCPKEGGIMFIKLLHKTYSSWSETKSAVFRRSGAVELEDLKFTGCKTDSALKIDATASALVESNAQNADCSGYECMINIRRCRFQDNFNASTFDDWKSGSATYYGGAIWANGAPILVDDCHFQQNVGGYGGAVFLENNQLSSLDVFDSTFVANKAKTDGGAIYSKGKHHIYNSRFIANEAGDWGGSIRVDSTVGGVYNCEFAGNEAANYGGSIYYIKNSHFIVKHSKFLLNKASKSGGALCVNEGQVTVAHCVFIGNTVDTSGGAIYVYDGYRVDIDDTEFIYNRARDDSATNDVRYPPSVALI